MNVCSCICKEKTQDHLASAKPTQLFTEVLTGFAIHMIGYRFLMLKEQMQDYHYMIRAIIACWKTIKEKVQDALKPSTSCPARKLCGGLELGFPCP